MSAEPCDAGIRWCRCIILRRLHAAKEEVDREPTPAGKGLILAVAQFDLLNYQYKAICEMLPPPKPGTPVRFARIPFKLRP